MAHSKGTASSTTTRGTRSGSKGTAHRTLHDVFVHELRDMYNAEQQVLKALPTMIKAASSDELRTAFETHLAQTEEHVRRLEEALDLLHVTPRGVRCGGMAGILEEGQDTLSDGMDGPALDAAIIGSAQRVEHYEIAVYGTLVNWARVMGHDDIVGLLEQNLDEDKAADQTLSMIAESGINDSAARQAHA